MFEKFTNLALIAKLRSDLKKLQQNSEEKQTLNEKIDQIEGIKAQVDQFQKSIDGNFKTSQQELLSFFSSTEKKIADLDFKIKQEFNKNLEFVEDNIKKQLSESLKSIDLKNSKNDSLFTAKIENQELIFEFDDGRITNLGKIFTEALNGKDGKDGKDGLNGKDGVGVKDINVKDCNLIITLSDNKKIELGNICGEQGPIGPIPKHEWDNTKLRFENPDGSWGAWVDLKGKSGGGGGSIGQPIISNIDILQDNKKVASNSKFLNFLGNVEVTKQNSGTKINILNGSGKLNWVEIDTDHNANLNSGILVNSSNLVEISLPEVFELGSIIKIINYGSSQFRITQLPGQQIHFGRASSTIGTSGSVESVQPNSSLELTQIFEDEFLVTSSIGNFKIF